MITSTGHLPVSSKELHRTILWLALPIWGEMLLTWSVSLWDVYLAGQIEVQGIAGVSTAAVGYAMYTSWLAQMLFMLVSTGTSALIARAWGAANRDEANRILSGAMLLTAPLAVGICLLLWLCAPAYATFLQMRGQAHVTVVHFLRTEAIGELFFGFCLVGASALRGAGDTRTPLVLLGSINLLNMVLSVSLVYGLGPLEPMGLNGIILGTVISRILGGLAILAALLVGVSGLRIRLDSLVPSPEIVRRIFRIGLPSALDGILIWGGHSVFLSIISRLGAGKLSEAFTAAHMIGVQVEALTYLPAVSWGTAAGIVIGQQLGSGNRDLALRAGHAAVLQSLCFGLFGAAVYLAGASAIFGIMTRSEVVQNIGIPALRFLAWYQIPLVVMITYIHGLRGAGETRGPMLINAAGIIGVRLASAYYFGIVLHGGLIGAWLGMTLDVLLRAIAVTFYYRRAHWLKIKV